MTELLQVEITFDIPDWFPPLRMEKTVRRVYPEYHTWAGQVSEVVYVNEALEELLALPNLNMSNMNIAGKSISFIFDDTENLDQKKDECSEAIDEILRKWASPMIGHDYVIQKSDDGGFEVIDLSGGAGKVVWVDGTYEECDEWVNMDVEGYCHNCDEFKSIEGEINGNGEAHGYLCKECKKERDE